MKHGRFLSNAVDEVRIDSGGDMEAAGSDTNNRNLSGESQSSMKGFAYRGENEIFSKVSSDTHSTPGDVVGAIGEYERVGPFNELHYRTISVSVDDHLWTNRDGSSWTFYLDSTNGPFETYTLDPYYKYTSDSLSRYYTNLYDVSPCAD